MKCLHARKRRRHTILILVIGLCCRRKCQRWACTAMGSASHAFLIGLFVHPSLVAPLVSPIFWLSDRPGPVLPPELLGAAWPAAPVTPPQYRKHVEELGSCARHGWTERLERARVVDASLFAGELDLLEARFYELADEVDVFFVVELGTTYSGRPRDAVFADCLQSLVCGLRFARFLDKIRYVFSESTNACSEALAAASSGRAPDAWACESSHRTLVSDMFSMIVGGQDTDVVIVSDADELPLASTARLLASCEVPDRVHVSGEHFYYSARCRAPSLWLRGPTAATVDVLRSLGGQALREAKLDEPGWANITDGAVHLAYFMRPEEIVERIQSYSHTEFNIFPFTSPAWHLENAASCTFNLGSVHLPCQYVPDAEIRYPRIPWYAIENREAMWRFFMHEAAEMRDPAQQQATGSTLNVAVCISGQLRGHSYWNDLRSITRVVGEVDTFVVVPAGGDCESAEQTFGSQSTGFVRCIPDEPLSPYELNYVRYGPQVDFLESDRRKANVLQYRLIAVCGDLLQAHQLATGKRYTWVVRKRADIFFRSFPSLQELLALSKDAIYSAYRDKDLHFGGLNDKLLLASPEEMSHVFRFHDFTVDPATWPSWRWLGGASTFGGLLGKSTERLYSSSLANVTGPQEALLHNYLLARGVPVRALRSLRYDRYDPSSNLSESNSLEPFAGSTGVFAAKTNPDGFSNVYPREPFLLAPLVNLLAAERQLMGSSPVVLDCGCGPGHAVQLLLTWDVSAIGIDGATNYQDRLWFYGLQEDLTHENDPHVDVTMSTLGILRARRGYLTDGLHIADEVSHSRADWVISVDVGSYIPHELQNIFMKNLFGYVQRGIVLRWGHGPYALAEQTLRAALESVGFRRDYGHERLFALFNGLLGSSKGTVLVYARVPHDQQDFQEPPPIVMASVDVFEPSHRAPHFSEQEAVWQIGETEVVVSYIRLWRAYLRPTEGWEILAPLRIRSTMLPDGVDAQIAWGEIYWAFLVVCSWDLSEILKLILRRNESILEDLVTAEQVVALSVKRAAAVQAGQVVDRPLLSKISPSSLSVHRSLARTLEGQGLPLGLHRQVWLNRLATRFWSG